MDSLSRRALLGAALGLSLETPVRRAHRLLGRGGEGGEAAAAPGPLHQPAGGPPPRPGEDRWRRALDAFEAAAGEVRGFEAMCRGRPFEEQEALQGEYDALGEAMEAALRRLLLAPAPDVAALARKIELAFAFGIEPFSGGETCLAAIRRDALRLASLT